MYLFGEPHNLVKQRHLLKDTARERVDEIGNKGPWTVTVYPGLGEGIEALIDTTLKWTIL